MADAISLWSFSQLRQVFKDQWELAREFLRNPVLVVPVLIVWFAFFGDAVHSPVITFFFLRLGATERDIGVIGTYIDIGYLFAAPLAGGAMDRYGPRVAILGGCLVCGVGCIIRAMATEVSHLYLGNLMVGLGGFHTTVMALISTHTPRRKRTLVIGGYQIQLTLVGMLGKFCYPIWHVALETVLKYLGIFSEILRDRITLFICPLACIIGVIVLLFEDPRKYEVKGEFDKEEDLELGSKEGKLAEEDSDVKTKKADSTENEDKNTKVIENDDAKASFIFLAFAVVLLAMAKTIGITLWPIYLRDALDWGSKAYSCLLLVYSITSIVSLAFIPTIETKFGKFTSIFGYAFFGSACTAAFWFHSLAGSYVLTTVHVVLAIAFYGSMAALSTSLSSLASLNTPSTLTASTFGVLALLEGLGSIGGHLAGTYLYSISVTATLDYVPQFLLGGIRLPFTVVVLIIVFCIGCISMARIKSITFVPKDTA